MGGGCGFDFSRALGTARPYHSRSGGNGIAGKRLVRGDFGYYKNIVHAAFSQQNSRLNHLRSAGVPRITPGLDTDIIVSEFERFASAPSILRIFASPKSNTVTTPSRANLIVRRLQVAVGDPLPVRRLQRVRNLPGDGERFFHRNGTAPDPLSERLAPLPLW